MNLEQAIFVYAGGPGSGCHGPNCGRPEGSGRIHQPGSDVKVSLLPTDQVGFIRPTGANTHNTRITMPSQATPHVPDVQRDWRRKKFQTDPDNPAKYFRKNSFTAKVYMELAAKPNEWHSISELMTKHGGKSIHGTMFALRDVGRGTGKWTVERRGDKIRLVPTQKAVDQGELFPDIDRAAPVDKVVAKVEQHLSSDPISSQKSLEAEGMSGGVNRNQSYIITFADGSKGFFKYEHGNTAKNMEDQTKAEVAAWQVAKTVGMADMVAPAVYRKVGAEYGALLDWQVGAVAHEVGATKRFDGETDQKRAAVFDYVIGNTDRHGGNWIVSNDGKIKLIDHGYAFGDWNKFPTQQHNRFIEHASDSSLDQSLVNTYKNALPAIEQKLKDLNFGPAVITNIKMRVGTLEHMKKIGDLVNGRDFQQRV